MTSAMRASPYRTTPSRVDDCASACSHAKPLLAFGVMAIATAMLAAATGTDTLGEGVVLGLVVGIGYSAAHALVDATFDPNKPQPWVWFAINGGYHALGLFIVALLVSAWR